MKRTHTLLPTLLMAFWPTIAAAQPAQTQTRTALDVTAAGETTFYADDRVGKNQLTFFSESTLEDFTGVCNQIGGTCRLDPSHLEKLTGKFSVRVENMKTGIDLRDEHMHSAAWLDAANYPEITIEITGVEDVRKSSASSATMTLIGKCALHGRTRDISIPCTLNYLEQKPDTQRRLKGDLIRLRARFNVKLSDYEITGPAGRDIIGTKVADNIELRATIFGSTQPPPKPGVRKP